MNNVATIIEEAMRRNPDRDALVWRGGRITFGELRRDVGRVAAALRARGLEKGDRVVVMVPMSAELYTVLLAVVRCGAAAVFVDPWISLRQIAAFASFAEPKGFIGVPRSHLLRLFEKKPGQLNLTAGLITQVSVTITQPGVSAPLAVGHMKAGAQGEWWATLKQEEGFLINKNETPFAPTGWDYYEDIKPANQR